MQIAILVLSPLLLVQLLVQIVHLGVPLVQALIRTVVHRAILDSDSVQVIVFSAQQDNFLLEIPRHAKFVQTGSSQQLELLRAQVVQLDVPHAQAQLYVQPVLPATVFQTISAPNVLLTNFQTEV